MGQIDQRAEVREFLSSRRARITPEQAGAAVGRGRAGPPVRPGPRRPANTTRFLYLDPAAREFFVDWDRIANDAAAMLRLEAGRNPHDEALIELVGELSTQSEIFRQRWASHDVQFHRSGQKRLRHPVVGQLDLAFESMELPSEPGLTLNVYTAAPGSPTADGLKMLASWAATQDLAEAQT
ncbi:transcriptional regulator [Nonomuraea insulae]|uniref:Transcriptional regulator n=1 Tax=Nonomuraea insulae TaxID=1616787 RepID=A0ABW1CCU6_9ACTN